MNKAALKVRFSERPEGEATMSPEMAGAVNYYRWIVAQLSPYLKDKVLDIGGGFGSHLEYILPLCKEVTSIDLL